MTGTEWQKKRGNRFGFLGATFLSVVCVGALVVIGLSIAASGSDQDEAPIEKAAKAPEATEMKESNAETKAVADQLADSDAAPVSGPTEREELAEVKMESPETEGAAIDEPVKWGDGETAYREKRYGDAALLFEKYSNARPDNAWGYFMLGLARWKAQDFEGAEEGLRQAIQIDSNFIKAQVNLARVLIDLDRAEEALPTIRFALEREPDNVDAWRILGRTAHTLGYTEEATNAFEEAISRNDHDAWAMNSLGLIKIENGDFEEAIGPLARAAALQDGVAVFQNNLGVALERTGHPAQAAEAYGRALEIDESYEKAAISLARVDALADESAETALDLAALAKAWNIEKSEAEVAQNTP